MGFLGGSKRNLVKSHLLVSKFKIEHCVLINISRTSHVKTWLGQKGNQIIYKHKLKYILHYFNNLTIFLITLHLSFQRYTMYTHGYDSREMLMIEVWRQPKSDADCSAINDRIKQCLVSNCRQYTNHSEIRLKLGSFYLCMIHGLNLKFSLQKMFYKIRSPPATKPEV